MQSEMAAFTNTRVVPLGEDGKPIRVQEYTTTIDKTSRPLSVLDNLFKEQEENSVIGLVKKEANSEAKRR